MAAVSVMAAWLAAAVAGPLVVRGASSGVAETVLGARTMLVVAGGGVLMALVVGGLLGALASRSGRWWDRVLSRFIELLGGFPTIVVLALVRALYPDAPLQILAVALALVRVPETARLVRLHAIRLRSAEFHLAARALGATPVRIFFRHFVPHLAASLAQTAVFGVGVLGVMEASMTFVGLGATASEPSWGHAIARAVAASSPGSALLPAAALLLTVFALYILGDRMRDRLDSRHADAPPCIRGA
jgi:peptide/nickel transport system permease protein